MRGTKPELRSIEGGLSKAPAAPVTLPESMQALWVETAADLAARGLLHQSMLPVLESYLTSVWMVHLCQKAIAEHGVLVSAGQGQHKANPACGIMSDHLGYIARAADNLGLSAVSRNRPALKAHAQAVNDADDPLSEFDV
ncbi:MAG TPA: phage terminase small subunit P27 family [Devosia sp.]|jgi:P27 family predicted phage terminase small subunit|nr:phage terminase small subunit P27 family [Devosia sp.]